MLINRFKSLRNDHRPSNKACKHCILRYKKSQFMLNVFIGKFDKYSMTSDELSPFYHLYGSSLNNPHDDGLIFKVVHSIDKHQNRFSQTILHLPFLAITRDLGFFKDNIVVHCSDNQIPLKKSAHHTKFDYSENPIIKIKPLLKANDTFLEYLDDNFWKYFLNLEKFLQVKKEKHSPRPSFDIVTHHQPILKKNSMPRSLFSMDSDDDEPYQSDSQVYIMFARKKNLRKNLSYHFDIAARRNPPRPSSFFTSKTHHHS